VLRGEPDDPRLKTVVGVAADVHTGGPTQEIRPEFYIPIGQAPPEAWRWTNRTMTIAVRAQSGDAAALTPTVRAAMKSIEPTVPVYNVATMNELLVRSMAEGEQEVRDVGDVAAAADQALGAVLDGIRRVAELVAETATVSRSQSQTMAELSSAIQSVEGVSIEAATRAESASSLATNQTASTEGMAETALRLAELSVRLKEAMSGFRV
jgi:hypothetical protein